jgi:hypothetical protein
MRRSEAFPSAYLNQDDVRAGPIRATIADVRIETLGRGDDANERPVIHFREDLKTFALNQTNWEVLEKTYGPDSVAWVGKPIELYHDPGVKFGRETVGGVRIRIPSETVAVAAEAFPWEQALAQADKAGLSKEEFLSRLKVRGLTGYHPVRNAALAREIIQAAVEATDNTIPF